MSWQFNPYAIPLFIWTLPVLAFARIAWTRRSHAAARYFLAFALATAGLMTAYGLELMSADLPTMMFWLRVEYAFTLNIPVIWLLFLIAYGGHEAWLTRWRTLSLFIIPTVHLLIVWTNDLHHLNWATTGTEMVDGLAMFSRTYGPMFYIGLVYIYLLLVIAAAMMIVFIARSPNLYRGQIAPLLIALIIVAAGSVLTIAGLTPVRNLDLLPFSYGLASIPIAYSLFRYRLIDIMPAAQSAIIKSMSDAILVIDSRSRLIDTNPAAEKTLRFSASTAVGQHLETALAHIPEFVARYTHDSQSDGEFSLDQGGVSKFFDLRISPLYDGTRLTGRIVVLRDITRLKKAEADARRYALELKQRNDELDAFSHTIAHDLKTPLSTIMGYADMLMMFEEEHLSPEGKKYITDIQRAGQKMTEMINELLRFARLSDIGSVMVEVPINSVVEAAVQRFQDDIQQRGIQIEIMPDMPDAMGQSLWIEEVFANLISNAIKYIGKDNPAPRIRIAAQRQDDGMVRYGVADNGLGIKPEDQSRLFTMFRRFHAGEASGLGLGLTIFLRIITRLGGQVGAKSEPGKGSLFWFTLQAATDEPVESVTTEPDLALT